MPQKPSPQDEKLLELQKLQGLTQPQDDTGDMVKMLGELYSIHQKQQEAPAQIDMLKSHANYYNQLGQERPEERQARAMQLELQGLDKAYTYDPTNPEYHQARKSVLSKYGYNVEPPAAAKPADAFGAGSTPKPAGYSIPPQYANDPEFQQLAPKINEPPSPYDWLTRLQSGVSGQPPEAILRERELRKAKNAAGVATPYTGAFSPTVSN